VKVFENRMLRKMLGSMRVEVVGSCIRLHNEELHNVYDSPNTVRENVEKPPRNSAGFCGGGQGLSWAVEPRKEEETLLG
jgi:hypothetical protein